MSLSDPTLFKADAYHSSLPFLRLFTASLPSLASLRNSAMVSLPSSPSSHQDATPQAAEPSSSRSDGSPLQSSSAKPPSSAPALRSKASSSSLLARSVASLTSTISRPTTPSLPNSAGRAGGTSNRPIAGPMPKAGVSAAVSPASASVSEHREEHNWKSAQARKAEREWGRQSEKGE